MIFALGRELDVLIPALGIFEGAQDVDPAYAAFEEADKGSIEPGKLADLTVLSMDIMKIPAAEILTTNCAMTVIGGEIVFATR